MNPAARRDFALTAAQRLDARNALALLSPYCITLEQAARLAIGQRSAPIAEVETATACDRFLRTRLDDGRRAATFDWYEERLAYVAGHFGATPIGAITRAQFAAWLRAGPWGASSKAGIARAARALWNWCRLQDPPWVGENVTLGCAFKASKPRGSTKVLAIADCEAILRNVGPVYLPAIALMLFAGIRPDEMAGDQKPWLPWGGVRLDERIIRIESETSKTGTVRILEELPDALWAWLRRPAGATNATPISPCTRRTLIDHAKAAGGFGPGKPWPQDALRHTFASYTLAHTQNAGQLAMWLGHEGSTTMLHRYYRGTVTRADAAVFYALRPNPTMG